jgi:hypothetical protein
MNTFLCALALISYQQTNQSAQQPALANLEPKAVLRALREPIYHQGGNMKPVEERDYTSIVNGIYLGKKLATQSLGLWHYIPCDDLPNSKKGLLLYHALRGAMGQASLRAPNQEAANRWLKEGYSLTVQMLQDPKTQRAYNTQDADGMTDSGEQHTAIYVASSDLPGVRAALVKKGVLSSDDWGIIIDANWTNSLGDVQMVEGQPYVRLASFKRLGIPAVVQSNSVKIINAKRSVSIPIAAKTATNRAYYAPDRTTIYVPLNELNKSGLYQVRIFKEGQIIILSRDTPQR